MKGNNRYLTNNIIKVVGFQGLVIFAAILFGVDRIRAWLEARGFSDAYLLAVVQIQFILLAYVTAKIYLPLRKFETLLDRLLMGHVEEDWENGEDDQNDQLISKFQRILKQYRHEMEKEYTADILKKQTEIDAMQSQINPHFLYNVFDSIRGQALTEGVDEIAEMTEALSVLFRYSVSTKNNLVTLGSELNNIRTYFKIQQYRFSNKFSMDILLKDNDQALLDCQVPKLMLQPLIENAIYHGLEMRLDGGAINVRIGRIDEEIMIVVSDNGVGIEGEKLAAINRNLKAGKNILQKQLGSKKSGTGIALTNVNNRIRLQFGDDYGMYIRSMENEGTDVELRLPYSV